MNILEAINEAKQNGANFARYGWNGKGQYCAYQHGYPEGIKCNKQTAEAWGIKEGEVFKVAPYLQIRNTQGIHNMWVPSISDLLAEDWYLIKGSE